MPASERKTGNQTAEVRKQNVASTIYAMRPKVEAIAETVDAMQKDVGTIKSAGDGDRKLVQDSYRKIAANQQTTIDYMQHDLLPCLTETQKRLAAVEKQAAELQSIVQAAIAEQKRMPRQLPDESVYRIEGATPEAARRFATGNRRGEGIRENAALAEQNQQANTSEAISRTISEFESSMEDMLQKVASVALNIQDTFGKLQGDLDEASGKAAEGRKDAAAKRDAGQAEIMKRLQLVTILLVLSCVLGAAVLAATML